jgi:L-ascorbate 6-phosphate lactonase
MFAAMALVVMWLGQASFRFDVGGRALLVDPYFAEHEERSYPPPPVDELGAGVDWLLVTHEHIDHLDPYSLREVAARSDGLTVVAPAPLEPLVREACPDVAFAGVDRGDRLDLPGVGSLTVVPAIHGRTVADGYPDDPRFVGYVLDLDGTAVYHTGTRS